MNAVASRLAGTNKVFGVLPLGTLNHFAKDLNIPLELGAAVDNIVAGAVSRVDVGEVNGRVFLNNSSIGLYPQIVLRRDLQRQHGRPKWIAFISANIGFLNLLPIPVLDGGHLVYYAIEGVLRRPMSRRMQEIGFQIGVALVLMLMVYVNLNDLLRVWRGWTGAG